MDASKPARGDFHRALGRRITELRKQQQLTQAELARALGLSQQSIFAIELGERRVSVDRVPVLTGIFGISTDELLGNKPMLPARASRVSPAEQRLVEQLRQLPRGDRRIVRRVTEALQLDDYRHRKEKQE